MAPHGVDTGRFRPEEPRPGADGAALAGGGPPPGRGPARTSCSSAPSSPARTCPTLVRAFARVADRHPDALLVLAGGDGWGLDDGGAGHRPVRGRPRGSCAPATCPTRRSRPAAFGGGRRVPGPLRGVRPAGARGPGLRGAAGDHVGDGHGGGGRRCRRAGPRRATPPAWPTPSTPSWPVARTAVPPRRDGAAGGSRSPPPTPGTGCRPPPGGLPACLGRRVTGAPRSGRPAAGRIAGPIGRRMLVPAARPVG